MSGVKCMFSVPYFWQQIIVVSICLSNHTYCVEVMHCPHTEHIDMVNFSPFNTFCQQDINHSPPSLVQTESGAAVFSPSPQLTHYAQGHVGQSTNTSHGVHYCQLSSGYLVPSAERSRSVDT
jgi:hypothetical protein